MNRGAFGRFCAQMMVELAREAGRAEAERVSIKREAIEQMDRDRAEIIRLRAELAEREKLEAACEPDITRAVEKFTELLEQLRDAAGSNAEVQRVRLREKPSELQQRAVVAAQASQGKRTELESLNEWCERTAQDAIAEFAALLLESIE